MNAPRQIVERLAAWLSSRPVRLDGWRIRVEQVSRRRVELDLDGEAHEGGTELRLSGDAVRGRTRVALRSTIGEDGSVEGSIVGWLRLLDARLDAGGLAPVAETALDAIAELEAEAWLPALHALRSKDSLPTRRLSLNGRRRVLAVADHMGRRHDALSESSSFGVECGAATGVSWVLTTPLRGAPASDALARAVRRCSALADIAAAPPLEEAGRGTVRLSPTAAAQVLAHTQRLAWDGDPRLDHRLRDLSARREWWCEPADTPCPVILEPGPCDVAPPGLELCLLRRVQPDGESMVLDGAGLVSGRAASSCAVRVDQAGLAQALADPARRGIDSLGLHVSGVDYWVPSIELGEWTWTPHR